MKININETIKNIKGEAIKDGETKEPLTLKTICTNALMGTYEEEKKVSGAEKAKRFQLAMKIQSSNGEAVLQSEEISLVKELIGRGYPPLVVGRAYEILDPKE